MANQPQTSIWEAAILQWETSTPALGGPGGPMNTPLLQLANRTAWLKQQIDDMAPSSSPAGTWTRVVVNAYGIVTGGSAADYVVATGIAPAFSCSPNPALGGYVAGQRFTVKFPAASSAPTLNVNGLGSKNIVRFDYAAAKIPARVGSGFIADLQFDGDDFIMLNPLPPAPPQIHVYDTPGTYTLIVPVGVYAVEMRLDGAGGGAANTDVGDGEGGGGGGSLDKRIQVTPGQTLSIIVGAGGSPFHYAGSAGSAGDGGNTSVSYLSGSDTISIVAPGGYGASSSGPGTGGAPGHGGIPTDGDLNMPGQRGLDGFSGTQTATGGSSGRGKSGATSPGIASPAQTGGGGGAHDIPGSATPGGNGLAVIFFISI